jgi:hypothetical protein
MEDFYPRLWANQTPNFILAFHELGTFKRINIEVKQVKAKINEWESRNSEFLENWGSLLRTLINYTKTSCGTRFEVRRTGIGPLEI